MEAAAQCQCACHCQRKDSIASIPFAKNALFTGREEILNDLMGSLEVTTLDEVDHSLRSVALRGRGGIGKTQIALQYVHTRWKLYDHIFWLEAASEPLLVRSLVAVAEHLGKYQKEKTLQNNAHVAVEWLRETSKIFRTRS